MTDEELISQIKLSKLWIEVDKDGDTLPVSKAYLIELFDAMLERLQK